MVSILGGTPLGKWIIKRADCIVVTSPQYRDGSKPLQKVKEKIRIVPNAIDEKLFELRIGDKERIQEIRALYNGKPIVSLWAGILNIKVCRI